jgi:hypothetical protein
MIEKAKSSDYLFIRIGVLSTKVIFLFVRCINNPGFWIIKFVATVVTSIFWCLSFSNSNLYTFTFGTYCNKIFSHLTKFIVRSFNKFIFFFYQNLISDFDIPYILIKKTVWEVSVIETCLRKSWWFSEYVIKK